MTRDAPTALIIAVIKRMLHKICYKRNNCNETVCETNQTENSIVCTIFYEFPIILTIRL